MPGPSNHPVVNIGTEFEDLPAVAARLGAQAANALMCRFVQTYAVAVAGLDPEDFEALSHRYGRGRGRPRAVRAGQLVTSSSAICATRRSLAVTTCCRSLCARS